jgi:cytidine deaminase
MHSEPGVSAIALTAAPCGHCRQFMNELSPQGEIDVLVRGHRPVKLLSLLPDAFGPRDLGFANGAFPVKGVSLVLAGGPSDALTQRALRAAGKSYAPYSKAYSGVAIATKKRTYVGSYIENAAYNPSLSPLQTALVSLVASGEEFSAISSVVQVELEGAAIGQRSATEAILSTIAPTVKLQVAKARMQV